MKKPAIISVPENHTIACSDELLYYIDIARRNIISRSAYIQQAIIRQLKHDLGDYGELKHINPVIIINPIKFDKGDIKVYPTGIKKKYVNRCQPFSCSQTMMDYIGFIQNSRSEYIRKAVYNMLKLDLPDLVLKSNVENP